MTTFSYTPSYPAQAQRTPKTRNSVFGDGYEQRAEDGINSLKEIWTLQFLNREEAEAILIDTFFAERKGATYFEWTTPTGVAGKFICRTWTYDLGRGNMVTINATFEQVFDP